MGRLTTNSDREKSEDEKHLKLMKNIQSVLFRHSIMEAKIRVDENQLHNSSPTPMEVIIGHDNRRDSVFRHNAQTPIVYQSKTIGAISANSSKEKLHSLARELAVTIKKHQQKTSPLSYQSKEAALSGTSIILKDLESFIEKSSAANYPILLSGPFGCEKHALVSAIHANSQQKLNDIIEINCELEKDEEIRHRILSSIQNRSAGSLFFDNIDKLSTSQQCIVSEAIESEKEIQHLRLIFFTQKDLKSEVDNNSFSRKLYNQINYLQLNIPPLSQRQQDIPYIIEALIEQNPTSKSQSFSDQVLECLQKFDWPENYSQLEQTLARLFALSDGPLIDQSVLASVAPNIHNHAQSSALHSARSQSLELGATISELLLRQEFEPLDKLHPGLQKALIFLAENFTKEICLQDLANSAFVSASHLSYLFKFHLGRTFKQILAAMRIEKAQQLFDTYPNNRITDVSFEVGFGDLSHFEKIFKRHTGLTPREYKKRI